MKMLFSENYSSTPTMKKVGQGTQKVKKVNKIEMSHYWLETYYKRFRWSAMSICWVIQERVWF